MLKPRPAVRAFGLAAVLALVGAGLIVAASQYAWHVAVSAMGGMLLVASVVLIALAIMAPARRAVTVELDDKGFRVLDAEGVQSASWDDVTKVTAIPGRLTFHAGTSKRFQLIAPEATSDLDEIADEVARRLDINRGYTPFV